jgi:Ca2+/H+ antiporter
MKRPFSKRVRNLLFFAVEIVLMVSYALIAHALGLGHTTYWALGIALFVIYIVLVTPFALTQPRAKEDL